MIGDSRKILKMNSKITYDLRCWRNEKKTLETSLFDDEPIDEENEEEENREDNKIIAQPKFRL